MKYVGPRLPIRALAVALLVLASGLFAAPARASSACAGAAGHGRVFVTGFLGGPDVGSLLYSTREGVNATAHVGMSPACFEIDGRTVVRANYTTDPGSAAEPADFPDTTGTSDEMCADAHQETACGPTPPTRPVQLPTELDTEVESAVEAFTFRVTGNVRVEGNPAPGVEPQFASGPVYLVDDDGTPRASMQPGTTYARSESYTGIKIPVFLAGPTLGSVGYTITPSGSSPATLGEDYTVQSPNPLPVGDNDTRVAWIELGIVNDQIGEAAESVTIAIAPGGGIAADNPASTTFTIQDNEESERPSSRFHHPRDNWRYKKSDYRIREVHVFATDTGGAGVVGSQLALRRNMKNGDCVWLTKEGWQKKDCSNRQWLPMTYDETGNLFYYRLSQLKSSVRTKIVDYTAFSRAIDGAGNVETGFDKKRNDNTFEIKRTRRRR